MSTVLTGVRLRLVSNQEHYFETPKSSASEQTISASMGNFSGVVGSLAIGQERTWRRGHKTLCRYSFSDLDLEKTCEYRRGLQLDDAERQSVLLVLLVNSSVRVVVTGRPRIFGARDSQPLHVVVQGRAFHPQTSCSAVRARDDAVRLF
jgi:hypothetical protein